MPVNTEANQKSNLSIRLHFNHTFLLNLFAHTLKNHLLSTSYMLGGGQGTRDTRMIKAMSEGTRRSANPHSTPALSPMTPVYSDLFIPKMGTR